MPLKKVLIYEGKYAEGIKMSNTWNLTNDKFEKNFGNIISRAEGEGRGMFG